MPFYVSPEQAMKDKADYARKGIARGRNSVVVTYDEGILFVAPNPSSALHKVSEIYDRIAFAAVGRYNEYENLREDGINAAQLEVAVLARGRAHRSFRRIRSSRLEELLSQAKSGDGEAKPAEGTESKGGADDAPAEPSPGDGTAP